MKQSHAAEMRKLAMRAGDISPLLSQIQNAAQDGHFSIEVPSGHVHEARWEKLANMGYSLSGFLGKVTISWQHADDVQSMGQVAEECQ